MTIKAVGAALGKMGCVTVWAALAIIAASCSSSPGTTAASTSTPAVTQPGKPVTIDLIAQNMAFDKTSISVPAGANVTVNFVNKETTILHNFAVYQTLSNGQTNPVFIGATINGQASIVYNFVAPAASGNYFFNCDVHPLLMNGKLIVTQ